MGERHIKKRQAVLKILRNLGYRKFSEASDGASAFNLLRRKPIEIIISAWEMPQMNGLALLKVVSSDDYFYKIPFIIVTPVIEKEMVVEAGKRGVDGIIVEPIEEMELGTKLHAILEGGETDEETVMVEMLLAKGKKLENDNKFDEAIALYRDILELQESAEVYYNIGHIKAAQNHYNEAIIAFRKAVRIDNYHARAYQEMGNVYIKKKEPQEAEKCFEKAGNIFLERNMDKEAEVSFIDVLKINPEIVNIYNSLGIVYRKRHDYKMAIKSYEMALKIDPKDERIYCNLGRAFMENRQITKAKKTLKHAIKLNPDFEEAKQMLQDIGRGF